MSSTIREREEADRRARGVIITHPNRNTIGGWSLLEGALPIQIAFVLVYLLMAYYASRWSRGVLPLGAGIAVLLGFFALVAGPGWFARNKSGFAQAGLNSGLLGVITLLIVPVQILLVVFAMRGFKQGTGDYPNAAPFPA
jgi:hypothetical protein